MAGSVPRSVCLLILLASVSLGTPIIIDDFTEGDTSPLLNYHPNPPATRDESGLSSVLGGNRDTSVDSLGSYGVSYLMTGGTAALNADVLTTGIFTFTYGEDAGATDFPYDLLDTASGNPNQAIVLWFATADYWADVTVTLTDSNGDTDSFMLSPRGPVGGQDFLEFPFSSYDPLIDFDSIKSIKVNITTTEPGTDCQVNIIAAQPMVTPDPATWCFFALLGSALAARQVKRKRQRRAS